MKPKALSIFVLFAVIMALALTSFLASAQEDEYLQRIDQAMAHLSGYLGKTITRTSHFWTWAEKIYNDESLDCPAAGQSYAQVLTRGYRITITVDEIVYDYRIKDDGSILVLCGEGGTAIYRTDTPVTVVPPPAARTTFTLRQAAWHAWIYMDGNDLLYLVNPDGEQTVLKRPEAPGEAVNASTTPSGQSRRMVITPNGRYLLQVVPGTAGNELLSLYDLQTGAFVNTIQAAMGETIYVGFGSNSYAGSLFIVNPLSTRAAVGFRNDTSGAWRLAIIDLTSGTITHQLNHNNIAPLLQNTTPELQSTLQNATAFFPRPVYFDNAGGVHTQLVLANAGGASRYHAIVWYPDANTANISPYIFSGIDILPPSGNALFTYQDTSATFLPPNGPFESHNAVAQGSPGGMIFVPQNLYRNSNFYLFGAKWADNGQRIIFALNDGVNPTRWAIYNPLTGAQPDILPDTYKNAEGVPGGLIAFDANNVLTFVAGLNATQQVWNAPPRVGEPNIIWVQPANTGLGLTSIDLRTWGQPGSTGGVAGVQLCAGAPVSRLQLGIMARVTVTDGTPLRLRETPGGTFLRDMAAGTQFVIIGGPQCLNNYTWWNVQLADGSSGWSAEGDNDTYFIEPLPAGTGVN